MLKAGLCFLALVLPGARVVFAQDSIARSANSLPPLTLGTRAKLYVNATVGPGAVGTSLVSAGIDQWTDTPSAWGQGGEGFARRVGAQFASSAVGHATEFAVSAARHEDPRYRRQGTGPFWSRAKHVIVGTYLIPRDDDPARTTWALSRVAGAFASAFVSTTWRPPGSDGFGEAAVRGGWAVASDMATSAFQEFWPDVKRFLKRKH